MTVEHIRHTVSGILGTEAAPVEEFSFGVNYTTLDGAPIGQMGPDSLYEAQAETTRLWFASSQCLIGDLARMKLQTFSWVGEDGLVKRDENGVLLQKTVAYSPGVAGGAGAANRHPFQCAVAVSLQTPRHGRTGMGRFYQPMPAVLIAPTGQYGIEDAQDIADAAAAWLSAMNDGWDSAAIGPGVRAAVVSSLGYATHVTSVRVGRAVDTMRSRRADVPEGYQFAAVTL